MKQDTTTDAGWIFDDDITFCAKTDCTYVQCFRRAANIRQKNIPHSFAMLEGTVVCPLSYTEERSQQDAETGIN